MSALWRPAPDTTAPPSTDPARRLHPTRTLTLAAVPTAVSAARRYVRHELTRVGMAVLIDDAELVTSELVTNAITATGVMAPDPTWTDLDGLAVIRIRLVFSPSSVVIEVWDSEASQPVQRQLTDDEVSGRGLFIVAALCTKWDSRGVPSGGKVVWGELARPVPTELPRRSPNRPPTGVVASSSSSPRVVDRPR